MDLSVRGSPQCSDSDRTPRPLPTTHTHTHTFRAEWWRVKLSESDGGLSDYGWNTSTSQVNICILSNQHEQKRRRWMCALTVCKVEVNKPSSTLHLYSGMEMMQRSSCTADHSFIHVVLLCFMLLPCTGSVRRVQIFPKCEHLRRTVVQAAGTHPLYQAWPWLLKQFRSVFSPLR